MEGAFPGCKSAAVKEAPDGAAFEAPVLQHVRGCSHVPENPGHCMVEDTLFLAMSFVEGIPRGQWAQIVRGQSFTTCVRDLLHQLSGAFAYLHSIAYHRDVGPHNIQVGGRLGAGKKFTLMDFGCAVRVADWHCDFECLVGDCHYWCPGAWLAEG